MILLLTLKEKAAILWEGHMARNWGVGELRGAPGVETGSKKVIHQSHNHKELNFAGSPNKLGREH